MKTVFALLIVFVSTAAWAQVKPGPKPVPQYEKFVKLSPPALGTLMEALNQWQRLVIYDPKLTNEDKVNTVKKIDEFDHRGIRRVPREIRGRDKVRYQTPG